jgi:hypothetical protein
MRKLSSGAVLLGGAILLSWSVAAVQRPSAKITIGTDLIIRHNGTPIFPIGFTVGPTVDARTPSGGGAYEELATNGFVFQRSGPPPKRWGPDTEAVLDHVLERSAPAGTFVAITVPDLQAIGPQDAALERELRRVVEKYRSHPALAFWKAEDEPAWGKVPASKVQRFYDIVHALDRDHPVWLTQAPRGTLEELRAYNPAYDIGAIDIYPIGYPPGAHSLLPNKNISMVGDYALQLQEITGGRKPFLMVLQICWSGVARADRTLRFPTFPEERYMTYQSIINGARGLVYFGGNVPACLNDRDRPLGWNWTFYQRVLKPVLDELNPKGPLYPALIAPDSKLPVTIAGAGDVEYRVREAGEHVYLLAAKREGATVQVKFNGLPEGIESGVVLFEEPRTIAVSAGSFTDWFGPNEVHVYRFTRTAKTPR